MRKPLNHALALLLPALLLAEPQSAHALQTLTASDGVTVEAVISIKDPTRIRMYSGPITNVFGNIYSSNCGPAPSSQAAGAAAIASTPPINPTGDVVVECDSDKGEVYVRPVSATGKPVNLFVSSANGTYTLLLRRSDTPADTIVIREKESPATRAGEDGPLARTSNHVRSLKAMLVAMSATTPSSDLRVESVHRNVLLWDDVRFTLTTIVQGRGFVGERYLLTNITTKSMVLTEPEFDTEGAGILAVSVENHNLRPGETTPVIVIRQADEK